MSKWISVLTRMPLPLQSVLVWSEEMNDVIVAWKMEDDDSEIWHSDGAEADLGYFWMPCPMSPMDESTWIEPIPSLAWPYLRTLGGRLMGSIDGTDWEVLV